jgi:hypothetical protein
MTVNSSQVSRDWHHMNAASLRSPRACTKYTKLLFSAPFSASRSWGRVVTPEQGLRQWSVSFALSGQCCSALAFFLRPWDQHVTCIICSEAWKASGRQEMAVWGIPGQHQTHELVQWLPEPLDGVGYCSAGPACGDIIQCTGGGASRAI